MKKLFISLVEKYQKGAKMNKEQKELIRKLNLKSIVERKEEYKYNKAGQLTLWKETNNTYWIDEKPYRKEETK